MRALFVVLIVAGCAQHVDEQRLPIGGPCNSSGQCGTGRFYCDTSHANGYCKAVCGKDADCPSGAVCVGAGLFVSGACLTVCPNGAGDCRAGDLCQTGEASAAWCDQPPIVDLGVADGGEDGGD